MIEGHYSTKYDVELSELAFQTNQMGRLAERQVKNAVNALIYGDEMRAQKVFEDEATVNNMEVEIDRNSTEILARRQPTAGDLRFVLMVIKTVNDLERIGDEANRVALMASRIGQIERVETTEDIEVIGSRVCVLLHESLNALEDVDDATAFELIRKDKRVNKKYKSTLKRLKAWMMEDADVIPDAVDILWAIRSLERIGDRACNICEHLIYFVRGADIRHLDIDRLDAD